MPCQSIQSQLPLSTRDMTDVTHVHTRAKMQELKNQGHQGQLISHIGDINNISISLKLSLVLSHLLLMSPPPQHCL